MISAPTAKAAIVKKEAKRRDMIHLLCLGEADGIGDESARPDRLSAVIQKKGNRANCDHCGRGLPALSIVADRCHSDRHLAEPRGSVVPASAFIYKYRDGCFNIP